MPLARRRVAAVALAATLVLAPDGGAAFAQAPASPPGQGGTPPGAAAGLGGAADPLSFGPNTAPGPVPVPVRGLHGMVVTAQSLASEVGARILAQGGNAVDATVAVAYALAVVYPAAGNLGGGGFLVLHQPDGQGIFLDFREKAPLAATATMYQDAQGRVVPGLSRHGWKAVAVPGTVAGMDEALRRWGHLDRRTVMEPAIALARDGFVLAPNDVMLLRTATAGFAADPASAKIFLRPDGMPYQVGDRLVQADLARSLQQIADKGADAFYHGPIAVGIVAASQKGGGILSSADFTGYHTRTLPPLTCHYHGFTIDTAPPPSGGGVAICEMLDILDGDHLQTLGLRSPAGLQRQIEAMRHTYSDRQDLGDPAFVKNPVARLLSPAYAAAIRTDTPTDRAVPSGDLTPLDPMPHAATAAAPTGHERTETTHFSIVDKDGRAVSMTYTLNGYFGAEVMAPGTGIVLNDEMDDFSSKPGTSNMFGLVGAEANAIAPGKTPLSSMSPTILSRDGHVVMVIGSPGGSRIPTITLEAILAVLDGGQDIAQAVNMRRVHEQWMPAPVQVEAGALSPDVATKLAAMGYMLKTYPNWGSAEGILAGGPSLAVREPGYFGGLDLRHPGGAAVGE